MCISKKYVFGKYQHSSKILRTLNLNQPHYKCVTHPNCALYEIQAVDQETSNGAVNGVSYRVVPYISLHINTLSVTRQ